MISYIQDKDINYQEIKELLTHSKRLHRFTNGGPAKEALERQLEVLLSINKEKRILCTSSGTTALHTLMFLYEHKANKNLKWITISYNFPSAVINKSKTSIIDIELQDNSFSIDLSKLSKADGVIIPTLFGTLPNNFQQLLDYCLTEKKILILDNASSPLTKYKDINICNYGASFGSAHHTKYLGFGEGGFLVIDKDDYILASALTNFGFHQSRKFNKLSSNFKMSDIAASFILSHIRGYEVKQHLIVQQSFLEELSKVNISPFNYTEGVVYGNLPIMFSKPISHLIFRDYDIEANKYYLPLESMKNSNYLFERMVNFPLHSGLSRYEIDRIVEQIAYQDSCGK